MAPISLHAFLMFIAIISPNRFPSLGQIGAFYFEIMNQSQVWINLEPQSSESGPAPVKLNFTVAFPGRETENIPDAVQVRAESRNVAFPQRTRQPILKFQIEDGTEMDLTSPGKKFQFTYHGVCDLSSGESCQSDTVIAQISFSDLHKIAKSKSLKIEALGFTLNMKPGDIQSLWRYVETVQNGVRLNPTQYGNLE
jgi:hypothetical protein